MTIGYPMDLYIGVSIGFMVTVAIATALDKFGDAMFARGVARPFFVGKHRLHHRSFLFKAVPVAYVAIAGMVLAGLLKIQWGLLWTGLAGTVLVAVDCLVLDMTVDYFRKGRGLGLLKHEVIYIAVPMYALATFLRLAI